MSESPSFDQLLVSLERGDERAARQVFERFASRLVALARSRLPEHVRRKEDPEDVVQSVFHSFFRRQSGGQVDLINWESLWGLLALITIRKCGHRVEFHHALRRDAGRELVLAAPNEDSRSGWQAIAADPTPSQAAILTETLERLLSSLDDRDRQILSLSLEGQTTDQIATQVRRSERTVQRTLEGIRQRLEAMKE
jgi:RNA polymerase sigma-70 factor (ECF subfamily)